MTQPIDVAYVDIHARSKDFRKEVDRTVTKELKSVEQHAAVTALSVAESFAGIGESVKKTFRDANGRLRDENGRFVKMAADGAEAVGGALAKAGETAGLSFQKLLSTFGNMTGIIGQLASSGPAGLAILAGAAVAAAGAVTALAAAFNNLLIIAGAGLAALPGLIVAVIAGVGVLKAALGGVSDAFAEQTAGAKKAGSAGVNNARQVADAQRGVIQAQKDLNKAREDELRRIRDINTELLRARASEARATDDVRNAQLELEDARKLGSSRAITEAELRLQEANASLAEAKDRTVDLAAEKKKADKNGVEGSEQVLRAQEALRDAQDRLAQSQMRVGAAAAATATAYSQLSANAKAFVDALVSAKDQLGPIKQSIQDAFFQGSAPLIQPIVDNIKELQPELDRVSAAFGKIFQEVLKFLGSEEGKEMFSKILTGLATFLEKITPAIGPLLEAFGSLAGDAGEFGDELGTGVADALLKIADFIKNVDLKQLFEDAKNAIKQLIPLVKPLLSITKDLFVILVEFGKIALPAVILSLNVFSVVMRATADAVQWFFNLAGKAFTALKELGTKAIKALSDAVTGLPDKITNLGSRMLQAGKNLIAKLWEGLGSAGGAAADIAKSFGNRLISVINNNVIDNINKGIKLIEGKLRGIPFFGSDVTLPTIPRIPQLEQGGLITKEGMFIGGEKGRKEGVLPLEDSRAMSAVGSAIADAGGVGGSGSGGELIQIFIGNEPIDTRAFRIVRKSNQKTARTTRQVPRMV